MTLEISTKGGEFSNRAGPMTGLSLRYWQAWASSKSHGLAGLKGNSKMNLKSARLSPNWARQRCGQFMFLDLLASPKIEKLKFVAASAAGDDGEQDSGGGSPGTVVVAEPKIRTKTPSMYRVILMNDDYTPMDFVIHVLQRFFNKDLTEATRIMLQVHTQGSGVCGVYSFEIAETKVYQVNQYSRQNRHPLKCIMEKA